VFLAGAFVAWLAVQCDSNTPNRVDGPRSKVSEDVRALRAGVGKAPAPAETDQSEAKPDPVVDAPKNHGDVNDSPGRQSVDGVRSASQAARADRGVPESELSPNTANPESALGKKLDDPVVQALVGDVYKNCRIDSAGHYSCPTKGVTIVFNAVADDTFVKQLFLYPNASGSTAPYKGPLPQGLTRNMTAEDVHAKLGAPTASGGVSRGEPWERYELQTLSITVYYRPATSDRPNQISYLTFGMVR
jgi:hypothetical protein